MGFIYTFNLYKKVDFVFTEVIWKDYIRNRLKDFIS